MLLWTSILCRRVMVNNKLYFDRAMKIVEILSYVFLIGSIVYLVVFSKTHPVGTVATHFNANGEPDAYGNPMEMVLLPCIFLLVNITMSVLIRFVPLDTWNYPIKTINPAAAPFIYKITLWMMVGIMFLFGAMSLYMSLITGKGGVLLKVGTVGFLVLVTIVTLGDIIATVRINKRFC